MLMLQASEWTPCCRFQWLHQIGVERTGPEIVHKTVGIAVRERGRENPLSIPGLVTQRSPSTNTNGSLNKTGIQPKRSAVVMAATLALDGARARSIHCRGIQTQHRHHTKHCRAKLPCAHDSNSELSFVRPSPTSVGSTSCSFGYSRYCILLRLLIYKRGKRGPYSGLFP